eukprot:CAMPEP_0178672536 /NCGR_PEP_ID=MMETSP0698-20121128/33780_1 /TAXON_ID=265572 /ORGANISM="Extubocellulus spinifer, Strain CCMP396" /LENGTH=90 /DNA_ID=CAMNT_0020316405 /DNA_START=348 /DNA_END=620 /DNA_ORIENTATION=+
MAVIGVEDEVVALLDLKVGGAGAPLSQDCAISHDNEGVELSILFPSNIEDAVAVEKSLLGDLVSPPREGFVGGRANVGVDALVLLTSLNE